MNKLVAILAIIIIIVGAIAIFMHKKKSSCTCRQGHNNFMSCQCHSRNANNNLVFPHIITQELYKNPYAVKTYNMSDQIPGFYKLKTKFPKLTVQKSKKI